MFVNIEIQIELSIYNNLNLVLLNEGACLVDVDEVVIYQTNCIIGYLFQMFITPLINYIDLDVASVLFDLKGYFQPFPLLPPS